MNKEKLISILIEDFWEGDFYVKGALMEINSLDGSLNHLEFFDNEEEFFEERGIKIPLNSKSYSIDDDYVRLKIDGSVESCSCFGVEEKLFESIPYIAESILANKSNRNYPYELKKYLNKEVD